MIDTDLVETKTINLRYVNKILSNCPNYDKIVNYEYEYGDTLSSKLIDWYRELIFSCDGENVNQLRIIYQIDHSLSMYVEDNQYKRGLSKILSKDEIDLNNNGILEWDELTNYIIKSTNKKNFDKFKYTMEHYSLNKQGIENVIGDKKELVSYSFYIEKLKMFGIVYEGKSCIHFLMQKLQKRKKFQ